MHMMLPVSTRVWVNYRTDNNRFVVLIFLVGLLHVAAVVL